MAFKIKRKKKEFHFFLEEEEEEARLLINFSVRSLRVGRSAAQFHDGGTERVNNKRRAGPARLHEFDCAESHETKKKKKTKHPKNTRRGPCQLEFRSYKRVCVQVLVWCPTA